MILLRRASPAPPLEGTTVLGVVVQLRHALLEQVSHLAALQKWQRQLVLSTDKGLVGENTNNKDFTLKLAVVAAVSSGKIDVQIYLGTFTE